MKKLNWLGLILALVMCLALVPAQAETKIMTVESDPIAVDSPYTNDELFALYVQGEMDKAVYGDAGWYGTQGRDRLKTDAQKALYDQLKTFFGMVAKGSSRSTVYTVDLSKLGVEYEFTNTSLGVDAIFAEGTWDILPEAQEKIDEATIKLFADLGLPYVDLGLTEAPLMEALLHDCPSELYWFDKTYGYSTPYVIGVSKSGSAHTYKITEFEIQFPVSEDYLSGQVTDYTIMTGRVAAVKTALENAQAIVDEHASKSDEEKLRAYMEEICALVSYNDDAADDSTNTPYGDPWQLVYVFDGNTYTNVVCEGYSKAFQYLCDLSEFDGNVYCYSVTGVMAGGTGEGRHMWNIVQTDDGNYLVDVTNCDTGTVGAPDELFMAADAEGKWDEQYTLYPNDQAIAYVYDSDVESMWGEEVLKLGETAHVHEWSAVTYAWTANHGQCTATRSCGCGDSETVSAKISEQVTKEATCQEKGVTTYTATFSVDWAQTQTVPVDTDKAVTNHVEGTVVLGRVEATCTTNGYTGDTCCAGCKMVYTYGTTIPAPGHDFSVEEEGTRTPSTCKTPGSVTMKCANCTETEVQELELDPENHVSTSIVGAKEAACEVEGYTGDVVCECGTTVTKGEPIPALEHDYQVVEGSEVLPTCKTPGSITRKCSACGDEKDEPLAIEPNNHAGEVETRNMAAATCSADGYSGDVYCLDCGSMITKGEVVAATGEHVYGKIVGEVTPTCTQKGSITTQCNGCDATTTEDLGLDASNHEGGTEVRNAKAPDCANAGYTGDTYCLGCNAKIADGEAIPATGAHNYADEVEGTRVDATCMTKGSVTMQCSGCGATEEQTLPIDPDNHTGNTTTENAAEPTCGEAGYTGDTVCECGKKVGTGESIPATGAHVYANPEYEWADDFSACTATGTCSGCDAKVTISASISEQTTPPTCAADGKKIVTATFAEVWAAQQSKEISLPATGEHVYGDVTYSWTNGFNACTASRSCGCSKTEEAKANVSFTTTRTATCAAEGEMTYTATFDKAWATTQTQKKTLAKNPEKHDGGTEVRDAKVPDCANAGYTGDTYCLGCGEKLETGEPISATGKHNFASEVAGTRVDATCMTKGSVTMQCTGCDATEEQTLPIDPDKHTGNTTTENAAEPTCGAEGYTGDTYCECGKKLETGEPIPATGDHKYTVEVEGSREAATCKDAGSVTMQCENCESTEEQTLPVDPTNHTGDTEVRNAKAPDCANAGYTGDTHCLGCDEKLKDGEPIPATGEHSYTIEVEGTRIPSTCKTPGKVTMQCSGCTDTEEQTLPIDRFNHTGNTTTENAAEPTCGAEGYTGDTYCECGMVIKMGQPIPATEEHDFTEIVEGSEVTPTCKTEGSLTLKCANCKATSVDKLGYDPDNHEGGTELRNAKAPDCTNAGYTGDTHCLGCGEKLKDGEPIPATGEHSYTIEVEGTRIPSTCKTPGKVTMRCSGCTDTEEQTLPVDPANHEGETEVRGAKEATCTEDGYTGDVYCLGCETVIEEGEAIPAGHEDEDGDGICDNCPAVLAYRIDIAPAEGGSASASSEKAAAGEEVIITLTPEDGMEMEYLVVVLADGRTITPRLVSENRYTFIQPEGDVTVHAFFKAIPVDQKVTVTFYANGGVGVMMPVQVTSGQPYTLPECAFLPAEGYTFKGWALTADGPVLPQSVTVGGSIDLYAIWQLEGASVPVPPATGDNANINLWLVMMALSAACIVYLLTGRKRKA